MGYTSRAVIAVHKTILAEDLINPIIPDALKEESPFVKVYDTDLARYWVIDSWKWYQDYPDIKAIEDFFEELSGRPEVTRHFTECAKPYESSIMVFGAVRMGENDDDIEEWGEPFSYDIGSVRYISHPNQE
jgi:hypothetical protein